MLTRVYILTIVVRRSYSRRGILQANIREPLGSYSLYLIYYISVVTKEEKLSKPQTISTGCNNGRSYKPTNEPTDASLSREHDSTTFICSLVYDSTSVSIEYSSSTSGISISSISSNSNRSSRIYTFYRRSIVYPFRLYLYTI